MSEPLLSVIIPVYGVEKYIKQCLDSVLKQTYKKLEVIVINDGTLDNSAIIAKEYASKDRRIKVYDFENGGLSVARNRGIELATGEYVHFLDSDDWIEPEMYSNLIHKMQQHDLDMIKCGFYECSENEKKKFAFDSEKTFKQHFDNYFNGILFTVVWNGIYKRALAKKVNYPPRLVYEDNYASGMYLFFANRYMVVEECFCNYRVNKSGISKGNVKHPLDKVLVIHKLISDLSKCNYFDDKLNWKLSVELYHFVRCNDSRYRLATIDSELCRFIKRNLDFRRRLIFSLLMLRKNIKTV